MVDFDVLARFLPIFYAFEESVAFFLAEVEVTVFVFHDEVYCVAAVLVLEVIQHVVGFPVIPRYHVIPVTILHRELYAAFANDVFEGYAFLAGDTCTVAHLVQCFQAGTTGQFFAVAQTSFGIGQVNIGKA